MSACSSLPCCLFMALAGVAVGVLLPQPQLSVTPPSASLYEREAGQAVTRPSADGEGLPAKAQFLRDKWTALMAGEPRLQADDSDWPRLAVGVFTTAQSKDKPFRDVIRSSWMQLPMVCPLSKLGQADGSRCRIFVTFVLGSSDTAKRTDEADFTTLPIKESMNCGKTRAWFDHAARNYPEATHIAKMDMDAFPHWPRLLAGLRNFSGPCENVFGGRSWTVWGHRDYGESLLCRDRSFCPPVDCGMPVGADFLKYSSDDPSCFSFMQGGLYFMSRQLALGVAASGGWWEKKSEECQPEDIIAGHAVKRYGTESNACVSALSYDSWAAYWHAEGPNRYMPEAVRIAAEEAHEESLRARLPELKALRAELKARYDKEDALKAAAEAAEARRQRQKR